MDRVTYYDMLAGCYKLKPDVSTNIIQRLGRLESCNNNYIRIALRMHQSVSKSV